MKAKVADIEHGKRGEPGEIKGVFYKTDEIIGKINLNNDFGLYGNLNEDYIKKRDFKPIPIAFKEEVELGKAQLLTTLDKNTVEKFDIRIVKLETQNKESQKSMVIEITDPKLLKKTGGIVQGMSGSPIIQKGK